MIPALQAIMIGIDAEERLKIALGQKTIIFLNDHQDYYPGRVVFFSHIIPWMTMATITDVRLTTLAEITESELKDADLSGQKLLSILRKTDHGTTMKSPVTVIRYEIDVNNG